MLNKFKFYAYQLRKASKLLLCKLNYLQRLNIPKIVLFFSLIIKTLTLFVNLNVILQEQFLVDFKSPVLRAEGENVLTFNCQLSSKKYFKLT